MDWTRDAILGRLVEILRDEIEGAVSFRHNDLSIPEKQLPCLVLLDGDETVDDDSFGRKRPSYSPLIAFMMPEIYVVVQDDPSVMGKNLNTLRRRIKAAILNDVTLRSLTKDEGIRYEGCQTALALGRSMAGEMGLNFTFVYTIRNEVGEPPESDTETPTP